MANDATGFLRGFLIAAGWRMANIAFSMSGHADRRGFVGLFMARIAIGFLARRQTVSDVRFVLFGVEKGIEIIPLRKIALWWSSNQPLFRLVADRAGLLRPGGELFDMALNAGLVTRKLQPLLIVAVSSRNQIFHQIALVMTGIASQFVSLKRVRHFDYTKMSLMREAFVIWWRRRRSRCRRSWRWF